MNITEKNRPYSIKLWHNALIHASGKQFNKTDFKCET